MSGVDVALAAQAATGFPSDRTPDELVDVLTRRMRGSAAVLLAFRDGQAAGLGLIEPVPRDSRSWVHVTDRVVHYARIGGTLVEIGGLAVHPDHARRGVAGALGEALMSWSRTHPVVAVASSWDHSPGSGAVCRRYGRVVGRHPSLPITLYCLDLPESDPR